MLSKVRWLPPFSEWQVHKDHDHGKINRVYVSQRLEVTGSPPPNYSDPNPYYSQPSCRYSVSRKMGPSILVDDSALVNNFNYVGDQWTQQTGDNSVYNGTLTICNTGSKSQSVLPSSLYVFFYGSSISFYGNMTSGVAANYTIDGTTRRPVQFPTGVSNGKTGINIFSLPNLTGFSHTLNIYPAAGQFVIDYVTYEPNVDTLLNAVDLIVDDADPELQYGNGQWNHTTGDFQQGRPYNGTMTGTNTMGATMDFSFVGSSITVNGLLNRVDGRLSASFVVDGQNSSATMFTPFDGQQENTDSSRWMLSQQFFHTDLTPGQHTLQMTLVNVSGPQMLWIDSVVFEGTSSTKLTPSTGNGSGGLNSDPGSSNSTFPKAAIAGIAAGVFLLAALCFAYARKKRQRAMANIGFAHTGYHNDNTWVPPPAPAATYSTQNPYDSYYVPPAPPPLPPPQPAPVPPPPPQQYRDQASMQPSTVPTAELTGSDGRSYAASSSPEATPNPQHADSYYTYSSKADLIGLEWGARESGSRGGVGDGAADAMPVPAHGDGAAQTSTVNSGTRNPALSNHAHEDGRDDGERSRESEEPIRERDAGPAVFPPAYDDALYGH